MFFCFNVFFGSSTQNHSESFGNHPQKCFLDLKRAKSKKKCKSTCKKSTQILLEIYRCSKKRKFPGGSKDHQDIVGNALYWSGLLPDRAVLGDRVLKCSFDKIFKQSLHGNRKCYFNLLIGDPYPSSLVGDTIDPIIQAPLG